MKAKLVNEAIKHMPGRDIYPPTPKYNYKKIQKLILGLRKLGYIVHEQENTSDYGRTIYWKIGKPNGTGFVGLGYKFTNIKIKDARRYGENQYEESGDYFYHNSHSGNIYNPSKAANGVWNHCTTGKPGPEGWYTFDDKYILDIIQKLKDNA